MHRRQVLGILGASAWGLSLGAFASAYPSRSINMMVGSTPGSATDIAARIAAQLLQEEYKQNVVVDNKPGAGGVLCMTAVAAAAPDGYTLQTGGLGHNVIPAVTWSGLPLDIPKAIMPIAQMAEFLNVLVVRADHPANSLQDLIRYQKEASRTLLYGSNGVGSSSHMTSELYAIRTGIQVEHVPYKGAADALIGTANGDLDFLFMNMPPTLPVIRTGRLKPLAVTSSYRSRQLPNVPTMQEQGMEDFDVTSWLGVYGPTGIPADIVEKLSETLVKGLARPEYREKLVKGGFEPKLRNAREFAAFSAAELERWGDVARRSKISIPFGK